jgi:cephalosporin hydroxylase
MGRITKEEFIGRYYHHIHHVRGHNPNWRNVRLDKHPSDICLYSEVIFKRRPDYIIETGTFYGGSALFFGDMLSLIGGKKVFSIDNRKDRNFPEHPFVEYINGSSADPLIMKWIKSRVSGNVMASLDSDHSKEHVLKELDLIAPIVTRGQYIVVEDAYRANEPIGPYYAIKEFLSKNKDFRKYNIEKKFICSISRDGWLRKI